MSKQNPPVIIVTYGCLLRSYRLTHSNHEEKIYKPLKEAHIEFHKVYIDNIVQQIDGVTIADLDTSYPKPNRCVTLFQEQIDRVILENIDSLNSLFTSPYYDANERKVHALRNSYLEFKVAEFLESVASSYDFAIVVNSDLWFDKKINPIWCQGREVVLSDQNPGAGFTNGFYCGNLNAVSQLLNTYNHIQEIKPIDYEYSLKWQSEKLNITINEENIRFLKIRATGEPAYQQIDFLWQKISHIAPDFFLKATIPLGRKFHFFAFAYPYSILFNTAKRLKVIVKQILNLEKIKTRN